jgi:hypothetical protein
MPQYEKLRVLRRLTAEQHHVADSNFPVILYSRDTIT